MLNQHSVTVAKDRLKRLVVFDRAGFLPEHYETMKRELYQTLSKYMVLSENDFRVDIYRTHIRIGFTGDKQ